mmetsp:Transcript_108067/g.131853  ORF Transcript_108067/g.131853 Transcript_108067/m.131853 type:complete len:361 (-) Transcript_108067:200-1282(-)
MHADKPQTPSVPKVLPPCSTSKISKLDVTDMDTSDWAGWILTQDAKRTLQRENQAERRRRLVHSAAERNQLHGRLVDLSEDEKFHSKAMDFAESCLMSLALWLRFGNADFAEKFGWVQRTDYAAMVALPHRAVDAAVDLWRQGMHATGASTARQRSVRQSELRAWDLGKVPAVRTVGKQNADDQVLEQLRETENMVKRERSTSAQSMKALMKYRASKVNQPGENLVRQAYEKLLVGQQHSLWDLWRKRGFVIQAALSGGGGGFRPVREALRVVRGYCGPDMDNEHEAWALAVDLLTITPFTQSSGPVWQIGDYAAFLREKHLKRCSPKAVQMSKARTFRPKGRPPSNAPGAPKPDLTGLG